MNIARPLASRVRRRGDVEIARPRVLAAFNSTAGAVRVLCAPPGSGKTTAMLQYAARHGGVALVTVPRGATKRNVSVLLAAVRDAREIVIDDADRASPEGREALLEEIETNRAGRRYLIAGSSRRRMPTQNPSQCEIALSSDASLLSFTSDEIRTFAQAHDVVADEADVEQLKYETDGWPLAVAWVVRDAARTGSSLGRAFELWRDQNGRSLLAFVAAELGGGDPLKLFLAAARSVDEPASQRVLERLDDEGYPIARLRARLRPYRILMGLGDEIDGSAGPPVDDRLLLYLFGRFSCNIHGRAVTFARRRDQNVLTFVALAPGGSATRSALRKAFWRDATPAAASQGLRTTLSRLRRAIADAGEYDADRYLRVDGRISLDLDHVWIDARRFADHIDSAKVAQEDGQHRVARNHYVHAQRLHVASILASEALEPCLALQVAAFEGLSELAAAQIAVLDAG